MARTYRTRLQQILLEEGRSQSWLARRVGCDRSHINRIANGLHTDDATREAIADALGRSVDDVFGPVQELAA